MRYVGQLIVEVLSDVDNTAKQAAVRQKVRELTRDFPLYAR
jgi:glycine hydroxymethyltransferase